MIISLISKTVGVLISYSHIRNLTFYYYMIFFHVFTVSCEHMSSQAAVSVDHLRLIFKNRIKHGVASI